MRALALPPKEMRRERGKKNPVGGKFEFIVGFMSLCTRFDRNT